jgi:hypothetical protein
MHGKRPELWPNNWTQRSSLQGTLYQAVSGPQNQLLKWYTHHIPLILHQITSGCLKNKVCLKGTMISGYQKH